MLLGLGGPLFRTSPRREGQGRLLKFLSQSVVTLVKWRPVSTWKLWADEGQQVLALVCIIDTLLTHVSC